MKKQVTINITIDWTLLRAALLIALFLAAPLELGSESISLSTTYPSPVGIYQRLVTTGSLGAGPGDTLLARDGGRVGIGISNPAVKLVVNSGVDKNLWVRSASDYGAGTAGVAIQSNNNAGSITQPLEIEASPLIINTASGGRVGINTTTPLYTLEVNGTFGLKTLILTTPPCALQPYGAGNTFCPAGQYATYVTGVSSPQMENSVPLIYDTFGNAYSTIQLAGNAAEGVGYYYTYDAQQGYMYCCNP